MKMLADQTTVADICSHYVLHTVITFGQAPVWNQHSCLFENSPTHLIPQLSTVQAGMHSLRPCMFLSGQDTQEATSLNHPWARSGVFFSTFLCEPLPIHHFVKLIQHLNLLFLL